MYVAAQGPLWAPGGDRGLYKTTDGGKTWTQVLKISEHTGVSDVVARSAQSRRRRRHVVSAPPSLLHDDQRRTGERDPPQHRRRQDVEEGEHRAAGRGARPDRARDLAGEPRHPLRQRRSGELRRAASTARRTTASRGRSAATTTRARCTTATSSPIPSNVDRIYVPDVIFQVSDDGGKTLRSLGTAEHARRQPHHLGRSRRTPNHMMVGNDGGLYRSLRSRRRPGRSSRTCRWPQFYDVDVDNAAPFYNVYGGLQDNNSLGGPSRTRSEHGILNQDWFVTQGGDGFVSARRSRGSEHDLRRAAARRHRALRQARPASASASSRRKTRAARRCAGTGTRRSSSRRIRTRGSTSRRRCCTAPTIAATSWKAVSPDLTRQIDRNTLAVMGSVWGPDAVAKNTSTALYGNISAIAESPKKEGLLYVGTDDGLDPGERGRAARTGARSTSCPACRPTRYIARIRASQHDAATVYVAVENHQNGDFAPYLLKSTDSGKIVEVDRRRSAGARLDLRRSPRITSIRGCCSPAPSSPPTGASDGGQHWTQDRRPADDRRARDRDPEARKRSRARHLRPRRLHRRRLLAGPRDDAGQTLTAAATLYPVRDARALRSDDAVRHARQGFQGEMLYTAPNPPYGAVLTYHLKDGIKTLKQKRDRRRKGRGESRPADPISDGRRAAGRGRRGSAGDPADDHRRRTARRSASSPVRSRRACSASRGICARRRISCRRTARAASWTSCSAIRSSVPYVVPGNYSVTLSQRVGGVGHAAGRSRVVQRRARSAGGGHCDGRPDGAVAVSREAAGAAARRRGSAGAGRTARAPRLDAIVKALDATPAAPRPLHDQARALQRRLSAILVELQGDRAARVAQRADAGRDLRAREHDQRRAESARWRGRRRRTSSSCRSRRSCSPSQRAALKTLVETDQRPRSSESLERPGRRTHLGRIPRDQEWYSRGSPRLGLVILSQSGRARHLWTKTIPSTASRRIQISAGTRSLRDHPPRLSHARAALHPTTRRAAARPASGW